MVLNSLSDSRPVGYYLGEMQPKPDAQLLREYAEHAVEAAFTELVHRHTNLVYSAALRQVESSAVAAEIAQNVFVGLARGAQTLAQRLASNASLAGWLCRSARNLSLNHRRDEYRRLTRERQAMEQFISTPEDASNWDHVRRVLDDVMAELNEGDYDALVLRFFQNQDFRTVGAAIGVSDDTAQKRVTRALEKLRDLLSKRGIRTTAAALSAVIASNAVQAAPAGLAVTISAAALAGTAVSSATVVAATTKTIAMTALQKTLVTATVAVLAGTGIYKFHQSSQLREQVETLKQERMTLIDQVQRLQHEGKLASNQLSSLTSEGALNDKVELLKLRGEVGVLRREASEANERANSAERKLAAQFSAEAQFSSHEKNSVNDMRLLSLAMAQYAIDNGDGFPSTIDQLTNELPSSHPSWGSFYAFDFVNAGVVNRDHPKAIALRERLARQAPDGTWRRIYGFADGRVVTATSYDGDFEAWEKVNTESLQPKTDQ